MRSAFLCKRRYMGKDVILDRYARLYEIPFQLARLRHDVRGFCLSYQGQDDGPWVNEATPASGAGSHARWGGLKNTRAGRLATAFFATFARLCVRRADGASDIPKLPLPGWLAKRLGVPYAADLYHNFEGRPVSAGASFLAGRMILRRFNGRALMQGPAIA